VRLREPAAFGAFAAPLLRDPSLALGTRRALAEHVFDLLPLPRGEDEAFSVSARAPRDLLAFAEFLIEGDVFTPLHLLHLVYALYLDRSLVTAVRASVGEAVLSHVIDAASAERVSALYASLHLSALAEAHAVEELRKILEGPRVRIGFKRLLARIVAPDVEGVAAWVVLAQEEGLLPREAATSSPEVVANLPRVQPAFAPLVVRWRR